MGYARWSSSWRPRAAPSAWSAAVPVDVPPPILDALRLRRLLHLRYRSEWGEVTERIVEPLGVTDRGGHVSGGSPPPAERPALSFRLDRIIEMDVIESFE